MVEKMIANILNKTVLDDYSKDDHVLYFVKKDWIIEEFYRDLIMVTLKLTNDWPIKAFYRDLLAVNSETFVSISFPKSPIEGLSGTGQENSLLVCPFALGSKVLGVKNDIL